MIKLALILLSVIGAPSVGVRPDFKPAPSLESYTDTISMVFIGDVMMHTKQLDYDHSVFLSALEPMLSEADIAVANLEFTLAGKPYTGYPCFSAPDSYLNSIDDAGIDVYLTANNHILDKGDRGLVRTLQQYEGKTFTGAGLDAERYNRDNPLIISNKYARIALVNLTYGTNVSSSASWPKVSRLKDEEVTRQMKRAKERGADFVIVLPHWGIEYQLRHSEGQQRMAEKLVDLGADAIIGAHPHVVQDTTHIKGVPVIYSMGNAVSNMSAPNTQLELAVKLNLVYNRLSGEAQVLEPELVFLWCSRPGEIVNNYLTVPIEDYPNHSRLWNSTLQRVKSATGIK